VLITEAQLTRPDLWLLHPWQPPLAYRLLGFQVDSVVSDERDDRGCSGQGGIADVVMPVADG